MNEQPRRVTPRAIRAENAEIGTHITVYSARQAGKRYPKDSFEATVIKINRPD